MPDDKDVELEAELDGKAIGKDEKYGAAIDLIEPLLIFCRMSGSTGVCILSRGLGIGFRITGLEGGIT